MMLSKHQESEGLDTRSRGFCIPNEFVVGCGMDINGELGIGFHQGTCLIRRLGLGLSSPTISEHRSHVQLHGRLGLCGADYVQCESRVGALGFEPRTKGL